MKFAMIGAGAMGLRYGILLQEAGNDVTFIDTWQPHIDKIREQGGVYVMRDHKDRHLTKIKLETQKPLMAIRTCLFSLPNKCSCKIILIAVHISSTKINTPSLR